MCCRYMLEESPELRPIVEAMNRSPLAGRVFPPGALRSSGEIRPSDISPVVAPDRIGRRTVFPMKWGFSGKSLVINARAETAAGRPMFRDSWISRRCAVPASCYFEWEHLTSPDGRTKTGTRYRLQDGSAPSPVSFFSAHSRASSKVNGWIREPLPQLLSPTLSAYPVIGPPSPHRKNSPVRFLYSLSSIQLKSR